MKARIRPVKPCALVWNYGTEQEGWNALSAACEHAGLALRCVNANEAGQTIGWLCGIPGASEAATLQLVDKDAYPAALILNGLDRKQLDAFLDELRAGGVRIPLKAMVTATNQNWTLASLLQELIRERDAFAQQAKKQGEQQ